MKTQSVYRDAAKTRHQLLATYLQLWAWCHSVDCVVLTRDEICRYLGMKSLKQKRVEWIGQDVKPLFREHLVFRDETKIAAVALFRRKLPDEFRERSSLELAIRALALHGIFSGEPEIPPAEDLRQHFSVQGLDYADGAGTVHNWERESHSTMQVHSTTPYDLPGAGSISNRDEAAPTVERRSWGELFELERKRKHARVVLQRK